MSGSYILSVTRKFEISEQLLFYFFYVGIHFFDKVIKSGGTFGG